MLFCENPRGRYACGKCRACKLSKANKKMIVSVFAAHVYRTKGQFLTLTFNDAHRPDGLNHSIFAGFMKRLRSYDPTPGVKFFMAGEYGESESGTHREHFHVLFYNHKYDMKHVEQAWSDPLTKESFGFSYDGTLTPASMKYVSGYVDKKGYDPGSGKRPPYCRSSVRIPDGLSDIEILKMCKTGQITYNGRKFSVPEIWRRRYSDLWKALKPLRDEKRGEQELAEVRKLGLYGWKRKDEYVQHVRAMMDERDKKQAIKKQQREINRLQRKLKRRIMYIMYSFVCWGTHKRIHNIAKLFAVGDANVYIISSMVSRGC